MRAKRRQRRARRRLDPGAALDDPVAGDGLGPEPIHPGRLQPLPRPGGEVAPGVLLQRSEEVAQCRVAPAVVGEVIANPAEERVLTLSLIHISEPTRLGMISYAVFCLK